MFSRSQLSRTPLRVTIFSAEAFNPAGTQAAPYSSVAQSCAFQLASFARERNWKLSAMPFSTKAPLRQGLHLTVLHFGKFKEDDWPRSAEMNGDSSPIIIEHKRILPPPVVSGDSGANYVDARTRQDWRNTLSNVLPKVSQDCFIDAVGVSAPTRWHGAAEEARERMRYLLQQTGVGADRHVEEMVKMAKQRQIEENLQEARPRLGTGERLYPSKKSTERGDLSRVHIVIDSQEDASNLSPADVVRVVESFTPSGQESTLRFRDSLVNPSRYSKEAAAVLANNGASPLPPPLALVNVVAARIKADVASAVLTAASHASSSPSTREGEKGDDAVVDSTVPARWWIFSDFRLLSVPDAYGCPRGFDLSGLHPHPEPSHPSALVARTTGEHFTAVFQAGGGRDAARRRRHGKPFPDGTAWNWSLLALPFELPKAKKDVATKEQRVVPVIRGMPWRPNKFEKKLIKFFPESMVALLLVRGLLLHSPCSPSIGHFLAEDIVKTCVFFRNPADPDAEQHYRDEFSSVLQERVGLLREADNTGKNEVDSQPSLIAQLMKAYQWLRWCKTEES